MSKTTLVWLQRELRLSHLPALQKAIAESSQVAVVYFHDPKRVIGEANTAWLSHSLANLRRQLYARGADLFIFSGDFPEQFSLALSEIKPQQVYYSFQVGQPFTEMQDLALNLCQEHKVALQPFYSEFWFDPGQLLNQQHRPYVVFTPFYKAAIGKIDTLEPLQESVVSCDDDWAKLRWRERLPAHYFQLPPSLSELQDKPWVKKIMQYWQVGETAAWERLRSFADHQLNGYADERDFPALDATSRLAPHLHFGEISSRMLHFELLSLQQTHPKLNAQTWLRQLLWREFARHLLWFFPYTETAPFQEKFAGLSWQNEDSVLHQWQTGQTGIPIIDAGMRELWETGFMHNRLRMLVASLLTKDLGQSWLLGQEWFAKTLVDADPANNTMGWQWVAGCGVDAAPYYRLFNPLRQSEKFDPQGTYIRKWVPELRNLSCKAIHAPWLYPQECALKGITLGRTYPFPMVDLMRSRHSHMARVQELKHA
ncbi:MAG: deoxyribodipyrimidine photo-lyase [Thiotrichales bacterium]|nr:deoxyribodipyrimidine photo-lyase [Thiotrichales bacterium]